MGTWVHVTWHIAFIWTISNTASFLWSLWIQLTFSNATTLKPTGLELPRSASSFPSLNITFFDLVTPWSIRRFEVRSGGWKNNRRENPIAFLIAFSTYELNPTLCSWGVFVLLSYLHIILYHMTWSSLPGLIPRSWDKSIKHLFRILQLCLRDPACD